MRQEELQNKMERSAEQILCSIKKRRSRSGERRQGIQLDLLADKIIEQCKVAILSIQQQELMSGAAPAQRSHEEDCREESGEDKGSDSKADSESIVKQLKFDNIKAGVSPEAEHNI